MAEKRKKESSEQGNNR
jgi:hypothetical protein